MQKRWRTVSWIALAIGTLFVGWEIRVVRIASMRRIYSELKYGDTRQIVLQKMGQPDSIGFGGDILYWDGVPQKESKDKKKYEFKYVIWKLGLVLCQPSIDG